jgi:outer membrane protein assembly factor BamD (BamD/ComL family)
MGQAGTPSTTASGTGSNWYFYNGQAISFGFNEFTKRWGERKLEDNWRRSTKEALQPLEELGGDTLVTTQKDVKGERDSGRKKKQEMINAIPSSPEAIEKSTTKIIEAYYTAALIYREQIHDLNAAAEMFEKLLERYPKCKYQLQTYYNLYLVYLKIGNTTRADYYKNIILNEHGDTEYAEIIRNPNYAQDKANQKSSLELFYEETYRKYLNGDYAEVIRRKMQADAQFPQNILTPKFEMLRTLAIGRTQPLPQFEASLDEIIRTYPDDPVKDEAQNILDYIHEKQGKIPPATSLAPPPPPPATDTVADKHLYTYLPDTIHYVVIAFQNIGGPVDGNKLKIKISNFNETNFGTKGLQISELMYDHRTKLLVIKSFRDKQDALSYHTMLYDNDDVYGNIDPESYQQYPVSENNYPELLRQKKFTDYEDFFRLFYK